MGSKRGYTGFDAPVDFRGHRGGDPDDALAVPGSPTIDGQEGPYPVGSPVHGCPRRPVRRLGIETRDDIAKEELTMIHPSTLAGPNWFTSNFGTTNPFQQNTNPFFRNTPFQGQQGGFGFGNNPFQNPTFGFGTNPTQIQNTISEIVRQTVPTLFSSFGFQPTNGFQTPFVNWNTTGFPTTTNNWTFGTQFQNTPFSNWQTQNTPFNNNWQIQNTFNELIRQTVNQTIQNLQQFTPTSYFQGTPQQQNLWNTVLQICQQTCYVACQTTCQAIVTACTESVNQQNTSFSNINPQNFWNICFQLCQQACQQVCQSVCQAVITSVNQQNPSFSFNQPNTPFSFNTPNIPFNVNTQNTPYFTPQNTPFNVTNSAPQFGFTPGIPTGAGAF
jgi:hypothetical protein